MDRCRPDLLGVPGCHRLPSLKPGSLSCLQHYGTGLTNPDRCVLTLHIKLDGDTDSLLTLSGRSLQSSVRQACVNLASEELKYGKQQCAGG